MRMTAVLLLGLTVLGGSACAGADEAQTSGADTMAMPMDSMAGMDHGQMGMGAAQDGQHEFLRSMSSHHEGLVRMGEIAMNRASTPEAQGDAHKVHEKQAAERDSMVQSIERLYGERHQPQPMPKNVAQADSLNQLTGAEYDPTFYRMVIDHHREGIAMIDEHLQHLTDPQVRAMAERMKQDQQREIEEFEAKRNRGSGG